MDEASSAFPTLAHRRWTSTKDFPPPTFHWWQGLHDHVGLPGTCWKVLRGRKCRCQRGLKTLVFPCLPLRSRFLGCNGFFASLVLRLQFLLVQSGAPTFSALISQDNLSTLQYAAQARLRCAEFILGISTPKLECTLLSLKVQLQESLHGFCWTATFWVVSCSVKPVGSQAALIHNEPVINLDPKDMCCDLSMAEQLLLFIFCSLFILSPFRFFKWSGPLDRTATTATLCCSPVHPSADGAQGHAVVEHVGAERNCGALLGRPTGVAGRASAWRQGAADWALKVINTVSIMKRFVWWWCVMCVLEHLKVYVGIII